MKKNQIEITYADGSTLTVGPSHFRPQKRKRDTLRPGQTHPVWWEWRYEGDGWFRRK